MSESDIVSERPKFYISIVDAKAKSYPPVDPSLVYFPIICDEMPSAHARMMFNFWYILPADGGARIFNLATKFSVVARNDQLVTVATSEEVGTVWSIEAHEDSFNVFTIWLSGQDLVWTLKGDRIVLRPFEEGLPEQEILFGFIAGIE